MNGPGCRNIDALICWAGVWIPCFWLCGFGVAFGYTLILYKDMKLEVISHGLGFIKRSYVVDLTRTESFTDKYVKSFFLNSD